MRMTGTQQTSSRVLPMLADELETQPALWRAAEALVPSMRLLPRDGERVAIVGCGTSYFIGLAYAALREEGGQGVTDAWPASEHRLSRGYDRIVALTRSGTTSEILQVLEQYPATVISADAASPAGQLDGAIVLADADEESVVQSRFATTALALLRASLGHSMTDAARDADAVLAADDLGPAVTADQVTFVGSGWTVGLADEAALKFRETSQSWAESYPAMEYRHGPISIAQPGRVVWALGEVPDGLPDDVKATGAAFVHHPIDPMAELVRVHRVCVARAAAAGLDVDRPRSLTRSVVLDR